VFPQLGGLRAQQRVFDAAAELAHHQRGDHCLQATVADARDGRAHVGDRHAAAAVERRRVGQRDCARGQLGFAQHETNRVLQVAVRIFERLVQAQDGIDTGGKRDLAAGSLGDNVSESF
jgi:hypothetical protein